ncbi:MAG: FAD-dependent oxidoreductase, partial [Chloroflexi bacterium]|nr:FAD-dependent oxidoreductase [Chloroflexota bacterium]
MRAMRGEVRPAGSEPDQRPRQGRPPGHGSGPGYAPGGKRQGAGRIAHGGDPMSENNGVLQADVAVVGSGPGGATVARELAKQGKKVVILERGKNPKWTGNLFSTFFIMDKRSLLFPKGIVRVGRALTTGGSSAIYCGTAVAPPDWIKAKYRIDLGEFVEEARREIGIKPLPDRLIGPASQRIMKAARDLGFNWKPMDKFIDPEKCELKCPHCMLGCTTGAIWTAREYVQEAIESGATLINQALVEQVLIENKRAAGLRARTPKGQLTVEAKVTVLAAGGMATPVLLRRAGIANAGEGLFVDPLIITYGNCRGYSSGKDIPMTTGTVEFTTEGIVMTDLAYPWPFYLLNAYWKGLKYVPRILGYGSTIGIMTKVRDGLSGRVAPDGTVSKPITDEDRQKLDKGATMAEEILKKAGADPRTIYTSPVGAAHPGGTV